MFRQYPNVETKISRLNSLHQVYLQSIRNLRNGPGYTGFSLTGRKFEYDENSSYVKIGLPNMGSTCYLASIFQCLNAYSNPIKYLINHRSDLDSLYLSCPEYQLLHSYLKLVYVGFNTVETNRNISFNNIVNEFFRLYSTSKRFKSLFPINTQHDAHEFLINFITHIDECIVEMEIIKRGISREDDFNRIYREYEERFSFGYNNFGFEFEVYDFCTNNESHQIESLEKGIIFTLPIDGSQTINECFHKAFNEFVFFDCAQCRIKNAKFSRNRYFRHLQDNFIIQFSRFKVNSYSC